MAVALISGAALGYEILLIRLYSIIQWHHFAYMIISLALLGFGASGTILALVGPVLMRRFELAFSVISALFGLSALGCFAIAQRLPFNALAILWDPRQLLWLLASYLLLMIPFFFAATCIGLTLLRFREVVGAVYGFDLAGAGVGSVGVVLLLYGVPAESALRMLVLVAMVAAALPLVGRPMPRIGKAWLLAGAFIVIAVPQHWLAPRISPYKGLRQALEVGGAEVVASRTGPLGLLTVVRNEAVPIRHAPGLSLASPAIPPEQMAVYTDGGALSVITRYDGRSESVRFLDYLSSAAPYHLGDRANVLVLGAGGGGDVLQALTQGAKRIHAVELNPQMIALVRDRFSEFAGGVYDAPGVAVFSAEARGFVAHGNDSYDLIQISLLDAFATAAAGVHGLSESYLYTSEAVGDYLKRLNPGGIVAMTRWTRLPPRDGPKLFATAVAALRGAGVPDPGARLAWIRSWNTSTLMLKGEAWTGEELQALRAFCVSRSFDLAWYPGMVRSEANRFSRLDEPYYFQAAAVLLGPAAEDFLERYKFNIEPATDDRPFFQNFFKWRTAPELLALGGQGGAGLVDLGYPILVATLAQAVVASVALILLPLAAGRRLSPDPASRHPARAWRALGYFGAIGLGFMFLEMAFIQKLTLFLAHPLYAVAVVLAGFLVFAGLGSRNAETRLAGRPAVRVVVLVLVYLWLLPPVLRWGMGWRGAVKIPLALLVIAPLAFHMGMLFPRGLTRFAGPRPSLLPWAWGVNGCASVVGAVLATVLALQFGFTVVLVLAGLLYGLAVALGGIATERLDGGGTSGRLMTVF